MLDPNHPRLRAGRALASAAALLWLAGCGGPDPQAAASKPPLGGCLSDVKLKRLEEALRRCDAVVAAHPQHPQPRNERALLLSLAGRQRAACRDSRRAERLLRQQPASQASDPLLREEISLRAESCRRLALTTPPAAGAPAGETPAAPPLPSAAAAAR